MTKITRKKSAVMQTISVRIPVSLYDELQAFQRALEAFDSTMVLDINQLVTTALKRDLKVAKEELEILKTISMKPHPTMQTTIPTTPATTGKPAAHSTSSLPTQPQPPAAAPAAPTQKPQ